MARRFFGTDGIRGRTNAGVMTVATAMRVGQAAGTHFVRGGHRHRVVIGKDTRLSGYMVESALVAGFTSVGMDVIMTGPLPTPAIALLTREMRADLGVMISASHNLFPDNGIKLFGPEGFKLSDETESAIEKLMESEPQLAPSEKIGRARRIDDARVRRLLEDAAAAHMNMLRVWGGGLYEVDGFYDACDELGILVWQDCAFACGDYPWTDGDFRTSVAAEIADNARRLRHHPSLALWCGNNEIEMGQLHRNQRQAYETFMDQQLPGWLAAADQGLYGAKTSGRNRTLFAHGPQVALPADPA